MIDRKQVLFESLTNFYAEVDEHGKRANLAQLSRILGKNPPVSLRTIDWLTTNFSKAQNLYVEGELGPVNVHIAYKSALKSVGKKLLDPFCRRERIPFRNIDGDEFYTTVGQLNFFRFAIQSKILQCAIDNADEIEKNMLKVSAKQPFQAGVDNKRKKRKELSRAANKSCTRTSMRCRIRQK